MGTRLQSKLEVLNLILSEKEVLFGKISDRLTHEEKINRWNVVAEKAKQLDVIPGHQDGKYVRDVTWQNWRKRSIAKRDKRNKTGEAGGKYAAADESDELIYQIIGNDSPVLEGLDVPESSGTSSPDIDTSPEDTTVMDDSNSSENDERRRKKCGPKDGRASAMEMLTELKTQRTQEQLELCRREQRIKDLTIFKLEKDLGLGPSEFTVQFHQQQGTAGNGDVIEIVL